MWLDTVDTVAVVAPRSAKRMTNIRAEINAMPWLLPGCHWGLARREHWERAIACVLQFLSASTEVIVKVR
jgi:hypothetical protein